MKIIIFHPDKSRVMYCAHVKTFTCFNMVALRRHRLQDMCELIIHMSQCFIANYYYYINFSFFSRENSLRIYQNKII